MFRVLGINNFAFYLKSRNALETPTSRHAIFLLHFHAFIVSFRTFHSTSRPQFKYPVLKKCIVWSQNWHFYFIQLFSCADFFPHLFWSWKYEKRTSKVGHFDKIAENFSTGCPNGPKSSILCRTGNLDWVQGFIWGCPKAYFWYFRQNVTRLVEDMKKKNIIASFYKSRAVARSGGARSTGWG